MKPLSNWTARIFRRGYSLVIRYSIYEESTPPDRAKMTSYFPFFEGDFSKESIRVPYSSFFSGERGVKCSQNWHKPVLSLMEIPGVAESSTQFLQI
jgi:hypothetical protein